MAAADDDNADDDDVFMFARVGLDAAPAPEEERLRFGAVRGVDECPADDDDDEVPAANNVCLD